MAQRDNPVAPSGNEGVIADTTASNQAPDDPSRTTNAANATSTTAANEERAAPQAEQANAPPAPHDTAPNSPNSLMTAHSQAHQRDVQRTDSGNAMLTDSEMSEMMDVDDILPSDSDAEVVLQTENNSRTRSGRVLRGQQQGETAQRSTRGQLARVRREQRRLAVAPGHGLFLPTAGAASSRRVISTPAGGCRPTVVVRRRRHGTASRSTSLPVDARGRVGGSITVLDSPVIEAITPPPERRITHETARPRKEQASAEGENRQAQLIEALQRQIEEVSRRLEQSEGVTAAEKQSNSGSETPMADEISRLLALPAHTDFFSQHRKMVSRYGETTAPAQRRVVSEGYVGMAQLGSREVCPEPQQPGESGREGERMDVEKDGLKGRWIIPVDLPKLSDDIPDLDWWFHKMEMHLVHTCQITKPRSSLSCIWGHCEDTFRQVIFSEAQQDGIDIPSLYESLDLFRTYITTKFTNRAMIEKIRDQLHGLKHRVLSAKEARTFVEEKVYCYNAKAVRQKGKHVFDDKDKADFFVSALSRETHDYIKNHVNWSRRHTINLGKVYAWALDFEADRFIKKAAAHEPEEPVMSAQRFDKKKNSPKRKRNGGGEGGNQRNKAPKTRSNEANEEAEKSEERQGFAALANASQGGKPPQHEKGQEPLRCYNCNEVGHLKRECTKPKREPPPRPFCNNCRRMGHKEETCWQKFPNLKQQYLAAKTAGNSERRERQGNSEQAHLQALAISTPASLASKEHWKSASDPRQSTLMGSLAVVEEKGGNARTQEISRVNDWVSGTLTPSAKASAESKRDSLQEWKATNSGPPSTPKIVALAFAASAAIPVGEQFSSARPCDCIPHLETQVEGQMVKCIIDTGASVSLIQSKYVTPLHTVTKSPEFSIRDVNGKLRTLDEHVPLTLEFSGAPYGFDFYLSPQLPADVLLGMSAIVEAGWIIDPIRRQLYHCEHALPPLPFAPCPHRGVCAYTAAPVTIPARTWKRIMVPNPYPQQEKPPGKREALQCTPITPPTLPLHGAPIVTRVSAPEIPVLLCNTAYFDLPIPADVPVVRLEMTKDMEQQASLVLTAEKDTGGDFEEGGEAAQASTKAKKRVPVAQCFDLSGADANWEKRDAKELRKLLEEYRSVWENPNIVGRAKVGEHRIDTGEALPVALPTRRVAWVERDKIQEEVNKMKEQNVVVDSESPWSSPPVLVKKKDGSVRFCIDYRKLNEATVADKYPLPRIDDVLDALSKGCYFSVIDLKAGYWQIPMRPQDAQKTAFRTVDGLFEFTVMPFGLKNAPATFQRMMDVIFSGMKWKGLMVYIIIITKN